jgi:hypothetical protein
MDFLIDVISSLGNFILATLPIHCKRASIPSIVPKTLTNVEDFKVEVYPRHKRRTTGVAGVRVKWPEILRTNRTL